ncbi:putative metal chaperone YciC [Thalassoglobus neptunius]|uniref:Putative metal chaperone YciC n=1 Tax=Thalassoglobus neptunius TaxID=1938619 RepID=A0A5C5UY07_9PLAN|nr:GTP-binding protein [Thalassoglobus neptunius]TWT30530.1 putative metal chaperone YciC [Thalassoglobus neptunius]
MEPIELESQVPLTILTGFLGSGKTTLLNRILNGDHGLRVAVLVNDFGAINIDSELVVGVEDQVMSLANGCICCTIRDDLVETVLETINRPESPEYILLEASGVADPGGISMTFMDSELRDQIRLDSVTCVLDAEQAFSHQQYPAIELLKLKQIGFADMMVLNKVDLAGPTQVQKVRDWANDQFNRLRIVEAEYGNVPLEVLLSVGRFDPSQLDFDVVEDCSTGSCDHEHHTVDHSKVFSTWSYETKTPMDLDCLREMVKRKLPATVYRCKGFVHSVQEPVRRAIVQCVGRRTDVTVEGDWGATEIRTRIVAIGSPAEMDTEQLQILFDECRAQSTESSL